MRHTTTSYVCRWCHADIEPDCPYRTPANHEESTYPAGVGFYVCSPACPERNGRVVYEYERAYPPRGKS